MLLEDVGGTLRYDVKIQLGSPDELFVMEALQHCCDECKKNPQFKHKAVEVAEHISDRFLNYISSLESSVPVIAFQVSALLVKDKAILIFNRTRDVKPGVIEENDHVQNAERPCCELDGKKRVNYHTVEPFRTTAKLTSCGVIW